jgi:hypothetical protein
MISSSFFWTVDGEDEMDAFYASRLGEMDNGETGIFVL